MKFTILMTALIISIFLADEAWSSAISATAFNSKAKSQSFSQNSAKKEKVVCSNNGVKITVDSSRKRTFITRKKGSRFVTLPMGRVQRTENILYNDQKKSVFTLSNKSQIEVSFSQASGVGLGYGVLTSGKSQRMYDLGDCIRSIN